jgi:hypothetical protein
MVCTQCRGAKGRIGEKLDDLAPLLFNLGIQVEEVVCGIGVVRQRTEPRLQGLAMRGEIVQQTSKEIYVTLLAFGGITCRAS